MKRSTRLLAVATVATGLVAFTARAAARPVRTVPMEPVPEERPTEGHYDARVGAAGYAPVVGTFGALAVPAVTVLFTTHSASTGSAVAVAFAAGLFVVTMIGSVIGSISLAAIGGESELTPNLTAAVMYAAVPVVVALADVVAAFEVLAHVYLQPAAFLLRLITGVAGALGVFFTALALGDSWATRPTAWPQYEEWKGREWLRSQLLADQAVLRVAAVGVLPVVAATAVRATGLHLSAHIGAVNALNLSGLALCVLATVSSALRTGHPAAGPSPGPRRSEAYIIALTTSAYVAALVLYLP
jgi:hypothetical protein